MRAQIELLEFDTWKGNIQPMTVQVQKKGRATTSGNYYSWAEMSTPPSTVIMTKVTTAEDADTMKRALYLMAGTSQDCTLIGTLGTKVYVVSVLDVDVIVKPCVSSADGNTYLSCKMVGDFIEVA